MADAFIGEIRAFTFNFCPEGWEYCNGQQVLIQQNSTLYAVIGATYGGDGRTYYNLPNLNGRAVIDADGNVYDPGNTGGVESVTLNSTQLAPHSHNIEIFNRTVAAQSSIMTNMPGNTVYLTGADSVPATGTATSLFGYTDTVTANTLNVNTLSPAGSATVTPHDNRMPFLALNFCICVNGYFPSRP